MKGEHGRDLVAELGKGTKVRVATVEVVAVENAGGSGVRLNLFEVPG